MHIPIARAEIASFLQISAKTVDSLWASGDLQKTLHCPYRPVADLNYSTVYDVLEYALASGDLPVCLSKELASLWIANLAEIVEWDDYEKAPWQRQAVFLLDSATEDGLAIMTVDAAKVASIVVLSQVALAYKLKHSDEAG